MSAQKEIEEIVRRVVERFQPEKVILFGSYARGNASPGSDADLLVVMPVTAPEESGPRRSRWRWRALNYL